MNIIDGLLWISLCVVVVGCLACGCCKDYAQR